MSAIEERTTDKLADMILNVLWQDPLAVWEILKQRVESEGSDTVKAAFDQARKQFIDGPFQEHLEVRWGMNLCLHCNDDNIEKNGIGYVQPSGDGLEFNQCLNCRIGILYNLVVANATMDRYVIEVGQASKFNGISFFWVALAPDTMEKFRPMYELVENGAWIGTISFDESKTPKFLPLSSTTGDTPRDSEDIWTSELPDNVKSAVDAFVNEVGFQIEVASD